MSKPKESKPAIDERLVETLSRLGSPLKEIADFLNVTEYRIRKDFRHIIARAKAARRIRIRQFQWKAATDGNITMLLFLGKVELGQGDEKTTSTDRIIFRRAVDRNSKSKNPPA